MPSRVEPAFWSLPDAQSAGGCFETMRAYGGTIFRLEAHLQRLAGSAQYLDVRIPERAGQMALRLRHALAASGLREAVVRIALIPRPVLWRRGRGRPDSLRLARASIVVQPVQPPAPELYARGITVAIVPTRRFPIGQIDPQAKFSARLGSVLAVMEAQLRGVDEAIFTDGMGTVTESTASNLGMIRRGRFLAPPCWQGLLAGVTWQALVEVARHLGMAYHEQPVTRHELYNADEAFVTSTIKEVLPVTTIDGRRIGDGRPGPSTTRLHRAFRALVRRELGLAS